MAAKIKKSIICILLITLLFSSCAKEAVYIDDESDDSSLTIYLVEGSDYYTEAINKFNKMVDKGEVDGRKIEIVEYAFEDKKETNDRILTEVMSGSGPDFLVVNSYSYSNPYKMMENGASADMDILIRNNPNFDPDDYKMDILDAGIIDGVRCFMPVGYSVPYMLATKENFEDYDIELPETLNIDSLFDMINAFNDQDIYFGGIYDLQAYAVVDAIYNYQSNQTIGSEYFEKVYKKLFKLLKEYPKCEEFIGDVEELGDGDASATIMDFSSLMINEYRVASFYYDELISKYGRTPVVLNVPCNTGDKSMAFVNDGLAININSKHKNDAFKFIMYLLSEDVQLGIGINGSGEPDLPVNKAASEQAKQRFINGDYLVDYGIYSVEIPKEFSGQLIDIIGNYNNVVYLGEAFYIMNDILTDVSTESYEKLVEDADSKLRIYFSE